MQSFSPDRADTRVICVEYARTRRSRGEPGTYRRPRRLPYARPVPVKQASARSGDPGPAGAAGFARTLLIRFEHLLRELGKFGVVGALSYVVDMGLFNYCRVRLHIEPLTAKTISTAIAATVAFIGNRFWTWRHRERSGLGREYALYFLLNAVGLGIGLACLALSHYALGAVWAPGRSLLADNISQGVVGMALGTMFRFWSYRRFVFRAPVVAAARRGPAGEPTASG